MVKISLQFNLLHDYVSFLQHLDRSTLFIEKSERQTDKIKLLGISQSELERNKFCFLSYRFILKAKQFTDESNIMGTKLV